MTRFTELRVGNQPVRMYERPAQDPSAPGVAVLHPWWGLNDDVVNYSDRLADAGYHVVAPDMFDGQVATTIEEAERLASGADEDRCGAIALAAVDHLAARSDSAGTIGALGFSFGAAWAIWAPTERQNLAATVVYYGTYTGSVLARAKTPVLGHFAESDEYEPDENIREFEQGLRDAEREVTIYRYPGTGHWFAEPSRDAYRREAAELAFERTVSFLRQHLGTPSRVA
jgi:carboxymethylenebutenolidase